jgi:thioester reductase-like protein
MEKDYEICFTVFDATCRVKANSPAEARQRFEANFSLHPLVDLKYFTFAEDSNETIINEVEDEEE